ncbi:MAG: signal peptidase I [Candidatus Syntrophonatronum acetioxidans]|uniref:Signal peptidase I n=1 Tax=Candidatus Syntrophonatronum acetioxidans TaxID=1795816 RepID=A0A424YBU8_9FIRM|nr:MAG: signal peptidase I [Candidatus Syntrophonatronum acetioxidans]
MKNKNSELWEWIKSIFFAVIIALLIRSFVVEIFVVEGLSMQPTLEHHERLLVNKFIYSFREPAQGDVVVFSYSPERDFIKRVIATGGDTVEINKQGVYVNGQLLEEDYVKNNSMSNFGPTTVPEDHIFVLGDNRDNSMDSRESSVGFISFERVKGKAVLVFWPLEQFSLVHNYR